MAISKLPDEMLQEFLVPTLSVPDEKFACTAMESPFSSVSQSSSTMLLVCKRWLRVATPLLYRTVILRSSAQAQALADSLRVNKALGRHIQKLRVEGGYGAAMHKILTSAPNISDLYLSLLIWSDDSVSGLCRSLSAINPSRVILHDDFINAKFNTKNRQLTVKLCDCIPQWTNLVSFHYPYYCEFEDSFSSVQQRSATIADALRKAPNLEIVSAPPSYWLPDDFIVISRNPSLKTIRIKGLYDKVGEPFRQSLEFDSHAKLRAMMTFDEEPVKKPEPIKQQVYMPRICITPLQQAPQQVQEQIWSEILGFALTTPDLQLMTPCQLDAYQLSGDNAWRATLLLVSKTFHRLALPHFYGNPVVLSNKALRRFSERLIDDPSLGLHLRSFFIWRLEFEDIDFDLNIDTEAEKEALTDIISRAPGLTRLYGVRKDDERMFFWSRGSTITWDMFRLLAETAGSSLIELESVAIHPMPRECVQIGPFRSFTGLRSLYWDCKVVVDAKDKSLRECLPLLESLHIADCDPSFLNLVSHMKLPALSRLVCHRSPKENLKAMLHKHGSKLHDLELKYCHGIPIFEMCHSLNVFSFTFSLSEQYDGEYATTFRCHHTHRSLTKLVVSSNRWTLMDKTAYEKLFADVNLRRFPALREIRVDECVWPTDTRKIQKCMWVKHSEELLKSGVVLTNKDGQPWRHRLKRSK